MFKKEDMRDLYTLSPMQEGMLFHALYNPDSSAYTEQTVWSISGVLDVAAFQRSWNELAARHPILRTVFMHKKTARPLQMVLKQREIQFRHEDLRGLEQSQRTAFTANFREKDFQRPFDLSKDPAISVTVLQTGNRCFEVFATYHHIFMDGWSFSVLSEELMAIYNSHLSGKPSGLPEPKPYSGFIKWLEKQDQKASLGFWKDYLAGYASSTGIPTETRAETGYDFRFETHSFSLDSGLTARLKGLATRNGVTLNTVIQSLWSIFLARLNRADDVVFGTIVSGRPEELEGVERMIGVFINAVPVRFRIGFGKDEPARSLDDFVKESQRRDNACKPHHHTPLADIQVRTGTGRDLIDHLLIFANHPGNDDGDAHGDNPFTIERTTVHEHTHYDFAVIVDPFRDQILIDFKFNGIVHPASSVARLAAAFRALAESAAGREGVSLRELSLVDARERELVLNDFNRTDAVYPVDRTLFDLFREQARQYPDRAAVHFRGRELGYRQLLEKAENLAGHLRDRGIRSGDRIGLCLSRSETVIVSILAIHAAGAAYMPMDPAYPLERLSFLMEDCGVALWITDLDPDRFPNSCPPLLHVDDLDRIGREPGSGPEPNRNADDLAYIIYTSGSTGRPKGVRVAHRSAVNFIHAMNDRVYRDYDACLNVALAASFVFDASVQQIFGALLFGHTLHVLDEETVRDGGLLNAYLAERDIHIFAGTPSLLSAVVARGFPTGRHLALKHLVIGGEPFPVKLASEFYSHPAVAHTEISNVYGPTECTVNVTTLRFRRDDHQSAPALNGIYSIGVPLANTWIYLLDPHGQPVPIGITGEIHVAGMHVAEGYHGRPELNDASFLPNPFGEGMIYKTGDLARYREDGNIEFVGRCDDQLKVRGHRIEPGEIETELRQYPGTREAVVLCRGDKTGSPRITAYIVPNPDAEPDRTALTGFLKQRLPDYMVPDRFVVLEGLPTTVNGKVDKRALAQTDHDALTTGAAYIGPRNLLERRLLGIWQSLLGDEKFGVRDSFFDLGGHSLTATRLVARVLKELSVEISLKECFRNPTIEDLARVVRAKEPSLFVDIEPAPEREYYDVSHAQKRLWLFTQMKGGSLAYHIYAAFRLKGALDKPALQKAFSILIGRHDGLRTNFTTIGGVPKQVIHDHVDFKIGEHDLSEKHDSLKAVESRCGADLDTPFDLECDVLLRVHLFRLAEHDHVLSLCTHHIISDGWSTTVLIRELSELYQAMVENRPHTLPPIKIQYKDFSEWQNRLLAEDRLADQRDYWSRKLGDRPAPLELPIDYPRPSVKTFTGRIIHFTLDEVLTESLNRYGRTNQVSLYMTLLTLMKTQLYRYTGQRDITVGTGIAGRQHADLEPVLGFFLNTLPLRDRLDPDDGFSDLTARVRDTATEAYDHQFYPFDRIVDDLGLAADLSRSAVFDVMSGMQNQEQFDPVFRDVLVSELRIPTSTAKFDFTLNFAEADGCIQVELEYNSAVFAESSMRRAADHFQNLARSAVRSPDQRITDLDIMDQDERGRVVELWNRTETDFPGQAGVVALFEEQAAATPDAPALWAGERTYSYRELNETANRAAHCLIKRFGARPGGTVGILADRGAWMVAGILGILKTGSAYVPIDPGYPRERIAYILGDARCRLIVTEDRNMGLCSRLALDVMLPAFCENYPTENPESRTSGIDPIYVMYTSGSTGNPKGVLVAHRSVVRLVRDTDYARLGPGNRILQLSNYAFDGSVFDLFGSLLNGAVLYMIPGDLLMSLDRLCDFVADHRIDTAFITTALFNKLVDQDPAVIGSFAKIYFGGQDASLKHVRTALEYASGPATVNHVYGPTECTTFATWHPIRHLDDGALSLPIGKPLANTRAHILDDRFNPQPIGIEGEICLGGPGLAIGYLYRPDLTAEKFVPDPFSEGERLYRTGDRGRRLDEGNIEFRGRRDGQLKIRGFRVEIGEIENRLLQHPCIAECIVTARTVNGNKELTGYLVPAPVSELSIEELRDFLNTTLPAYMIPAHFAMLESLPLTPNGKVDTHALPDSGERALTRKTEIAEAGTETEQKILEIWQRVLGKKEIGIHDNYFALGGDSIKAIQVSARLHQEGLALEARDVFQFPTVAELASRVSRDTRSISQDLVTGPVPLTPIQTWFFREIKGGRHHFNQDALIHANESLDEDAIRKALETLRLHHDALRIRYQIHGDHVIQTNEGTNYPFFFETYDLRSFDNGVARLESCAASLQAGIDLANGPVMKAALFKMNDGDRLLIISHHLVVDGVSWRILIEDLERAYAQAAAGETIQLPDKTHSFKDWSSRLRQYAESEGSLAELDYWRRIDSVPVPPLPRDHGDSGGAGLVEDSRHVQFHLTAEHTEDLLGPAHGAYSTEVNDLLLTALSHTLQQWTRGDSIVIDLEGHGREPFENDIDITRTVGWFTTMFPVVLDAPADRDPGYRVKHVKESLRAVPNKGFGYGVLKYLTPRDLLGAGPLELQPRISFNYLGRFDAGGESKRFRPARESAGYPVGPDVNRLHDLDIVGVVMEDRLEMTIYFNKRRYRTETMETLAASYRDALIETIQHCLQPEAAGLTPSDIDYDGFGIEELDNLLDSLAKS